MTSWFGIGAPKNTPAEIVQKLNNEINAALFDPKFKARLTDQGGTVLPGSPADFGRLIAGAVLRSPRGFRPDDPRSKSWKKF